MITLTQPASKKIKYLLESSALSNAYLRLAVQPGGCSGLRYQLFFDDRDLDNDIISREYEGFEVRIDKMSMPYLDESILDYADTIEKQGFTIDNPKAGGTCACGDSFHSGNARP
jgi:iron-sulfur cluster assembly accessory protein